MCRAAIGVQLYNALARGSLPILLMSRTERYLGHAIDRSDFERRLRVVRRRI